MVAEDSGEGAEDSGEGAEDEGRAGNPRSTYYVLQTLTPGSGIPFILRSIGLCEARSSLQVMCFARSSVCQTDSQHIIRLYVVREVPPVEQCSTFRANIQELCY